MVDVFALVLALAGLAGTLIVAVTRPPWLPEGVAAILVSVILLVTGSLKWGTAEHAVESLLPTIAFLAALLLLADGCRRQGLFAALGAAMAKGSRGSPRRLLALVFVVASTVTATLGLDPTIVLLTPVVFATATSLRMSPKPHVYACAHLANSASLLLPISNLTNLLVFGESHLSFLHFAVLMVLPTVGVIAVEWVGLRWVFATELGRQPEAREPTDVGPRLPRLPLLVVGATLVGFLLSSPLSIDPAWIAGAGAVAITLPGLVRRRTRPRQVVRAVEPLFLVFVLGLAMIVAAAGDQGLDTAVHWLLPVGNGLGELLGIAAVSAVLANVVNNLPAILLLAPGLVPAGHGAVLAALIGVNVGPNMTFAGSLATLLWWRVLRSEGTDVNLSDFFRLGAVTVPAGLVASTVLLWAVTQVRV